jgi:hypothetical protein
VYVESFHYLCSVGSPPDGGTKGSGLHPQRVYSDLPYIFFIRGFILPPD